MWADLEVVCNSRQLGAEAFALPFCTFHCKVKYFWTELLKNVVTKDLAMYQKALGTLHDDQNSLHLVQQTIRCYYAMAILTLQ